MKEYYRDGSVMELNSEYLRKAIEKHMPKISEEEISKNHISQSDNLNCWSSYIDYIRGLLKSK